MAARKKASKRKAAPKRKTARRKAAPRRKVAAPRRSVPRELPKDEAWRELVETAIEQPDPEASAAPRRRSK